MKIVAKKNAVIDPKGFSRLPKTFLVRNGIKPEQADYFVNFMVKNQVKGEKLAHSAAVMQVQNFVSHLAKTPLRLQKFIEKFCEKFPLPKS